MKGQSFKFSATQQWLVGYIPFHLKRAIEVTRPLQKSLTSTDFYFLFLFGRWHDHLSAVVL